MLDDIARFWFFDAILFQEFFEVSDAATQPVSLGVWDVDYVLRVVSHTDLFDDVAAGECLPDDYGQLVCREFFAGEVVLADEFLDFGLVFVV